MRKFQPVSTRSVCSDKQRWFGWSPKREQKFSYAFTLGITIRIDDIFCLLHQAYSYAWRYQLNLQKIRVRVSFARHSQPWKPAAAAAAVENPAACMVIGPCKRISSLPPRILIHSLAARGGGCVCKAVALSCHRLNARHTFAMYYVLEVCCSRPLKPGWPVDAL